MKNFYVKRRTSMQGETNETEKVEEGRRKEEKTEKRRNSMLPKKMSESLNSDTYSRGFGGVAVFSMQKS